MTKRLYIFEGPDGCGKTTAATRLADVLEAEYVHSGPLPDLDKIGDVYARAMLPAYLGYQDVVMDRCWMSEMPYGNAFRGGKNRLSAEEIRSLVTMAKKCQAVVIKCLVPWNTCQKVFSSRPEMLKNTRQLNSVYEDYTRLSPDLPTKTYDWTKDGNIVNFLLKDAN